MGGGRLTRNENNGDRRQFEAKKINVGALLKRLWKYLGRNRLLLVLAAMLSISSSVLSLMGPRFSGRAINAIEPGAGNVDFEVVWRCAILMFACYAVSGVLSYLLLVDTLNDNLVGLRYFKCAVFCVGNDCGVRETYV